VVDDDPDIRGAMTIALRAEGAVIDGAEDGSVAIHRIGASRPDALVLDMMLPGQSGFSVLERCRALEPPIPVVMVTANQGRRHAALATSLGATAYLVKPVPLGRLVDAVCGAIGR
jgi:DNA-binding response OmpR family regulator